MQAKHELQNILNIMTHFFVPNSKGLGMCLEKEENRHRCVLELVMGSDKTQHI